MNVKECVTIRRMTLPLICPLSRDSVRLLVLLSKSLPSHHLEKPTLILLLCVGHAASAASVTVSITNGELEICLAAAAWDFPSREEAVRHAAQLISRLSGCAGRNGYAGTAAANSGASAATITSVTSTAASHGGVPVSSRLPKRVYLSSDLLGTEQLLAMAGEVFGQPLYVCPPERFKEYGFANEDLVRQRREELELLMPGLPLSDDPSCLFHLCGVRDFAHRGTKQQQQQRLELQLPSSSVMVQDDSEGPGGLPPVVASSDPNSVTANCGCLYIRASTQAFGQRIREQYASMPSRILAVRTATPAPAAAVQERAVHYVLYSLHSSRNELVAALAALQPRATRPIAADQAGSMSIVVSERAGKERPHDIEREIAAQMAWLMASSPPPLLPSTPAKPANAWREGVRLMGMGESILASGFGDQYGTDVDMEGQEEETVEDKEGDGKGAQLAAASNIFRVILDTVAAPRLTHSETPMKRDHQHAQYSFIADASIELGQCHEKTLVDFTAVAAASNPGTAPAAAVRMGSRGAVHCGTSAANTVPFEQTASAEPTTVMAVTTATVAALERPEESPFTPAFTRRLPHIATLSGILGNPQRAETPAAASLEEEEEEEEAVDCEVAGRTCSTAEDMVGSTVRKRAWEVQRQKWWRPRTGTLSGLLHLWVDRDKACGDGASGGGGGNNNGAPLPPAETVLLPCPTRAHIDGGAIWHQTNPATALAAHHAGQHGKEAVPCDISQSDTRMATGAGVGIGAGATNKGQVAVATAGDCGTAAATTTRGSVGAFHNLMGVMEGPSRATLMTARSPDCGSRWKEPLLQVQAPPQRPMVLHAGSKRVDVAVPTDLPRHFADENKYDGIHSNSYCPNHTTYHHPVFGSSPKRCRRNGNAVSLDESQVAITTTTQGIIGPSWLIASETGVTHGSDAVDCRDMAAIGRRFTNTGIMGIGSRDGGGSDSIAVAAEAGFDTTLPWLNRDSVDEAHDHVGGGSTSWTNAPAAAVEPAGETISGIRVCSAERGEGLAGVRRDWPK
ncbi:hypothetical protein Vretifemale_19095 [Volvox reticuliferus]|uniref:Uncharacterized protein n=1 Tax=Volvox reticuliferus TaxID=1737510 RepID=A0A8J4D2T1_9CHLO|nr:hypothetical protein Vretifemale_19095 [Volvox reticuliferus]